MGCSNFTTKRTSEWGELTQTGHLTYQTTNITPGTVQKKEDAKPTDRQGSAETEAIKKRGRGRSRSNDKKLADAWPETAESASTDNHPVKYHEQRIQRAKEVLEEEHDRAVRDIYAETRKALGRMTFTGGPTV